MPVLMLRRLVPILVLTALMGAPAAAQIPLDTVAELADASAVVVTGRVTSVGVLSEGGAIYTYASVDVSEVVKGELDTTTIVVKQLGGTLRTLGLYIAGQAQFQVNEEALLFLAVRPRDLTLYTAGLARGKWRLATNLATGGPTALLGPAAISLDAALRAAIRQSRPHPQDFRPIPPEMQIARPAYTFIGEGEGGPARWHTADDGGRVPVDFQTGGSVPHIDAAIAAWNGVGTTLEVERGGSGNAVCPAGDFTGNGRIALYWNDPCNEIGDGDPATFGIGGGYFTPGFQKTVNGVTFNGFVQGLAILNNVGPHVNTTSACLQDAVTHVLGHAIGLGDSGDSGALMRPTLRSGCTSGASGLAADDSNGLRAIYPAMPSGGVAPHAPVAITASVVLDTVTLSWTPAPTGGPAQSYVLEAGSQPGLADIATFTLNNAGTSTVVGAVPQGLYYVRVRAQNVLGTSLPSPDHAVTVGACEAPGAPTGIVYSTADNLVTIGWTPPATGVVQGYWLFAGYAPGDSSALVTPLGPVPAIATVAPYGNYYVRLAARNSCAVGPVTADVLVSVMPCTAVPAAPTGLAFSRTGNIVNLSWTAPAAGSLPSRYRIVAGSAPGAADLLIHTTGDNLTSFSAFAPAGTYFVRVQGQNNCGVGVDSNELQIVVP